MSDLKRLRVKYIRDGAKALYDKDIKCFICEAEEELQLHHYNTLTPLYDRWERKNKIIIKSVDDIMFHRKVFIKEHQKELYNEVVTLCKKCHNEKLHKVYGKVPLLSTAKKQKNWCIRQKDKLKEKENVIKRNKGTN